MKGKLLAIAAVFVFLAGSVWLTTHAQSRPPAQGPLSTNWVGYLVLGEVESMDQITRGPYPSAKPEGQLGLRSDGVIVWRPTLGKNFTVIAPQSSPSKKPGTK